MRGDKSNKTCNISTAVLTSSKDNYVRVKKLVKEELNGHLKEKLIVGITELFKESLDNPEQLYTICPSNEFRKSKWMLALLNNTRDGYLKYTGILPIIEVEIEAEPKLEKSQ